MKVENTDKKTFQLKEKNNLLGQLIYKSLLSESAKINIANSTNYEIKPVGLSNITVTKNNNEVANLKMNAKFNIVITFQDGKKFYVKNKNALSNKYIIENEEKEKLIQLDLKSNSGISDFNYDISFGEKNQDILFVLIGVYAVNYHMSTSTSIIIGGAI